MFGVGKRPDGLMRDVAGGAMVPRPGAVTAAVGLLVLSAILWATVAGGDPRLARASGLLLFLLVLFAVRAGLGRRKARITVAVVAPLLLLLMLSYLVQGSTGPDRFGGAASVVVTVVGMGCACAGLALFFTRGSSAYIQARTDVLAAK
ncbi:hypothetical protein ACFXOY_18645 [Streptomyces niveus]|uniref:hypothetical protein n=1 Tax=Streptomyces niveus TaxID=193462 RepID=UPI00369525B6